MTTAAAAAAAVAGTTTAGVVAAVRNDAPQDRIGHLADGTPYFAPIGAVVRDLANDRVVCHLCGGFFRAVGGTHLARAHGWTIERYREEFQLPKNASLCAVGLSDSHHASAIRHRLGHDLAKRPEDTERAHRAARDPKIPRWRSLGVRRPDVAAELHPTRNGGIDAFAIGAGSSRKLWWLCPVCACEWKTTVHARCVLGTGCPHCRRRDAALTVPASRSLAALRPELAQAFHPTRNGDLDPCTIGASSTQTVWWRCPRCGHEWQARVVGRVRSQDGRCASCAARARPPRPWAGPPSESFAAKRPEQAAELHPWLNRDVDLTKIAPRAQGPLIWWRCALCRHEWQTTPNRRKGCPSCAYERRVEALRGA